MENLWLKIKIWTKITIFSLMMLYILLFVLQNMDQEIIIWWWFGKRIQTSALQLIPAVLVLGVFGTLVVRMAFRAWKQILELKKRNANSKLQKDMADIRTKAAMLQTKPTSQTASPSQEPPSAPPLVSPDESKI